jgi:DNA (cytosine-5)-methyltransferase 1
MRRTFRVARTADGVDIPSMLNGLSLFSGIGGIDIALAPWVRPVAYCENNRYAQCVLLSRMAERRLPVAPICDDVRTLRGFSLPDIDIIYGGFPCQDISVAGTGAGLGGERSGLVSHVFRLARECRPHFIFLENVPALSVRGLDRVLLELHALGYDARWTVVSAAEVGAVHIRERWFLLAHANGLRLPEERGQEIGRDHSQRSRPLEPDGARAPWGTPWSPQGLAEPRVDRTGDGLPHRLDRHSGLGNSVVPAATREAFVRLMGITEDR